MDVIKKQRIINSKFFIDLEKYPILRKIPVKRVVLFTNARDEKNIKEWAAHHLLLGFSLIYILTINQKFH